jgi:hypothetical protein
MRRTHKTAHSIACENSPRSLSSSMTDLEQLPRISVFQSQLHQIYSLYSCSKHSPQTVYGLLSLLCRPCCSLQLCLVFLWPVTVQRNELTTCLLQDFSLYRLKQVLIVVFACTVIDHERRNRQNSNSWLGSCSVLSTFSTLLKISENQSWGLR